MENRSDELFIEYFCLHAMRAVARHFKVTDLDAEIDDGECVVNWPGTARSKIAQSALSEATCAADLLIRHRGHPIPWREIIADPDRLAGAMRAARIIGSRWRHIESEARKQASAALAAAEVAHRQPAPPGLGITALVMGA